MSALNPRQMFLLDSACQPLMEVFGWSTYLVGTAMQPRDGKPPRDIDVRTIVDDKQHDKLRKAIGAKGIAFLGIAIGQYLASLTDLPIDYQIQRMTEANALHDGMRNPLGHRNLGNYKGDAQPEEVKARSLEGVAPGITQAFREANEEAAARPKRKGVIGSLSHDVQPGGEHG